MSSQPADRTVCECTNMNCHAGAQFAYWMADLGQFSRVRSPEHDLLDDGDLAPYVCGSCRDYMADSPHWDADGFVRPEEKLVTDGGTERRDPVEDSRVCSICGVYIGFGDGDYCDGCAREIGAKPPLGRCMHCGQRAPQEQMESVDVSPPGEYYPTIRHLCRGCSGGESV